MQQTPPQRGTQAVNQASLDCRCRRQTDAEEQALVPLSSSAHRRIDHTRLILVLQPCVRVPHTTDQAACDIGIQKRSHSMQPVHDGTRARSPALRFFFGSFTSGHIATSYVSSVSTHTHGAPCPSAAASDAAPSGIALFFLRTRLGFSGLGGCAAIQA